MIRRDYDEGTRQVDREEITNTETDVYPLLGVSFLILLEAWESVVSTNEGLEIELRWRRLNLGVSAGRGVDETS